MNFSKLWMALFLLIFGLAFGQSKKNVEHKIGANETLTSIAQKYKVSTNAIIELNPNARNGIQLDKVLLIPQQKKIVEVADRKVKQTPITHLVKAKETKYSISKLYAISIEDLEKINPFLTVDGLQVGQILQLNSSKLKSKVALVNNSNQSQTAVYHIIMQHETKYSVSKKYGIAIEDLEVQNPEIKNNFPIGLQLIINCKLKPNSNSKPTAVAIKNAKADTADETSKATKYRDYKVKKGETVYSLARLFDWSQEKLVTVNPELKNGVAEGMVVKGAELVLTSTSNNNNNNNYKDLSKSLIKSTTKELVLFLPFNINKIENDTLNSIGERLKKDKFLNLTLDFYSGALMAIDSAKVLNMNLNVRIYDSEETKNSSSAVQIINNFNFQNTDVVIGPFYQSNVEKVAEALADKSTFVISPLSKENGKSFKNLLQSMPTSDAIKNEMFDFMRAKSANIIAIIDPKKVSIKQYIEQNQKNIQIVNVNEKGSFVADSIKKYFVKDKMNYVVMESERTGVIFTTTTTLINAIKEYQVQLVILEPNETLDFDEIALSRLTKLKMMYPSTTFGNETDEAKQFEKNYKKKNKIYPNQFAIRGFDLVFDTIVRLSQVGSFEETINQNATKQIQNTFDYTAKPGGGYSNNGISILYYDTDLQIKQAQ